MKRFASAKRRLAVGIDDARREGLVAAMLEDVLAAISESRSIERTIVVSSDPRAVESAAAAGAELVTDPDDGGHSEAGTANEIAFAASFPTAGHYRLYLQFKHEGAVRTVEFTVSVPR